MNLPKGTVVLDVGNGVKGTLRDDAEIDIEGADNHDDLAAALVAGNRPELLPELAHTTEEGTDVVYSVHGNRIETPETETGDGPVVENTPLVDPVNQFEDAPTDPAITTPVLTDEELGSKQHDELMKFIVENEPDQTQLNEFLRKQAREMYQNTPPTFIDPASETPISSEAATDTIIDTEPVAGEPVVDEPIVSGTTADVADPVIEEAPVTETPAEVVETIPAAVVDASPAEVSAEDAKKTEIEDDLTELAEDLGEKIHFDN